MATRKHTIVVGGRKNVIPIIKYSSHDLIETSYYIGKGITLFTMFYCTMNSWFYKKLRKDVECDQEDDDEAK